MQNGKRLTNYVSIKNYHLHKDYNQSEMANVNLGAIVSEFLSLICKELLKGRNVSICYDRLNIIEEMVNEGRNDENIQTES